MGQGMTNEEWNQIQEIIQTLEEHTKQDMKRKKPQTRP